MKRTFLTFLGFIIIAFVAFLLFSTNGFLGEDIGKTGKDISVTIKDFVNQKAELVNGEKEKKQKPKPVLPEDSQTVKFFEKLKTASPEDLANMIVQGFKPMKANSDGEPPIVYMARYNNNLETYEIMLNVGASVAQTNRAGENALKIAIERGAPLEIIRLLYADQEEIDKKIRQEKIKQGPGPKVVSSYYPSLENGGVKKQ